MLTIGIGFQFFSLFKNLDVSTCRYCFVGNRYTRPVVSMGARHALHGKMEFEDLNVEAYVFYRRRSFRGFGRKLFFCKYCDHDFKDKNNLNYHRLSDMCPMWAGLEPLKMYPTWGNNKLEPLYDICQKRGYDLYVIKVGEGSDNKEGSRDEEDNFPTEQRKIVEKDVNKVRPHPPATGHADSKTAGVAKVPVLIHASTPRRGSTPRRTSREGTEKTTPHRPSLEVRPWTAGAPTAKDVEGRCRKRQDKSRHHVSPTHCPQALGMAQRQFKRGHHNGAEDTETIQGFRVEGRGKSLHVILDT
jgi:hypothetical protein